VNPLNLNPGGNPPGISFNAWEHGVTPAPISNWAIPQPRSTTPLPFPRVNLYKYTGTGANPRGMLFVNDVLRNSASAGAGSDYSPNDFRLAPMASENNVQFGLNPLVNQGLRCLESLTAPVHHIYQIAFANGTYVSFDPMLGRIPGLPSPLRPNPPDDLASFHGWDWDCEGIGNPRDVARPPFFVPDLPDNPTAEPIPLTMDLGADELDELIIAGFIDGTRIFSRAIPQAPAVTDHTRLFFLNVYTLGNSYSRPLANRIRGRLFGWWSHVQQAPIPDNYTGGVPGSLRAALVSSGRPRFMRNLECDFSPHLFPDPHPIWAEKWQAFGSSDVYAALPWWTSTGVFPYDNAYLYYNPSPGYPAHLLNFTTQEFMVSFTQLLAGVVNPPGTGLSGNPNEYLHPHFAKSVLGPWAPCTAAGSTYSVGPNGLGSVAAGCPDVVPIGALDEQWQGFRYNAQRYVDATEFGNVQTFLAVNGVPTAPPDENVDAQDVTPVPHQLPVEDAARRLGRGQ